MDLSPKLDNISSKSDNSMDVKEGYILFTTSGTKKNREDYIDDSIQLGQSFTVLDNNSNIVFSTGGRS